MYDRHYNSYLFLVLLYAGHYMLSHARHSVSCFFYLFGPLIIDRLRIKYYSGDHKRNKRNALLSIHPVPLLVGHLCDCTKYTSEEATNM